jgi:hypothetical protein
VEWTKSNNFYASTAEGLIKDRSQLSDPTKIIKIGAGGLALSDLSPFAEATELRGLYLGGTRVSDLSPLAGLKSLEYLDISGTQVTDLSPLMSLPNLIQVGVTRTPVSDESVAKLQQALPNCSIYGKRLILGDVAWTFVHARRRGRQSHALGSFAVFSFPTARVD